MGGVLGGCVAPETGGLGSASAGTSDGDDGQSDDTDDGGSSTGHHAHADDTGAGPSGGYHPIGFAAAEIHGLAAKLAQEDCRECHGDDLAGGVTGIDCDACHEAGWRSDCVYCHGGEESPLGAPPRDIDGSILLDALSFQAHTAHVTEGIHAVFDCSQCHAKPTDVLTSGHLFDGTPAIAEVELSAGLSKEGLWAAGTCGSLYCHGNGNGTLGAFDDGAPAPGCGDCHAFTSGGSVAVTTMSGQHKRHVDEGIACSECHGATVDAAGAITQPILHVNGFAEVAITGANVSFTGTACTGLCHTKLHFGEGW